jgi:hypothetical protein
MAEIDQIAIHEASHAVCLMANGRKVQHLVAGLLGGRCLGDEANLPAMVDLLISDSGFAAEKEFCGAGDGYAARFDAAQARQAVSRSGVTGLTLERRAAAARNFVDKPKIETKLFAHPVNLFGKECNLSSDWRGNSVRWNAWWALNSKKYTKS